ncbi:MAG: hypothetical protein FJZ64_02685, partial [Chlamydiae bacterium]|nr:hypothetical protein [Chlamydiota bacterium]
MSSVVCILTAGKGSRMGPLSCLNKALLPFKGEAILTHIIRSFPEKTKFVIALGYKGSQVREYIAAAHPNLFVQYVEVDRFEGEGTGPGYSLLACKSFLTCPFYFISCDTLFKGIKKEEPKGNWIGVSSVPENEQASYCNAILQGTQVTGLADKKAPIGSSLAFTGLMYIHDFVLFFSSLSNQQSIAGEHQISNGLQGLIDQGKLEAFSIEWKDLGTYEKYREAVETDLAYDFSKHSEHLYFTENRVIKFFVDSKIIKRRIEKAFLKKEVFPAIQYRGEHFYSYDFIEGKTLYAQNSPAIFSALLEWLEKTLWTPVLVESDEMTSLCKTFYQKKTEERLLAFKEKYPSFTDPTEVNGEKVPPLSTLLQKLPWQELFKATPTFIHGDLQFDNILYNEKTNQFTLIDWRQDFAGKVEFGDLYYDLAKLRGGMILNYDYIKKGLFYFHSTDGRMEIDFAHRFLGTTYERLLRQFVEKRHLSFERVQLLTGLI